MPFVVLQLFHNRYT